MAGESLPGDLRADSGRVAAPYAVEQVVEAVRRADHDLVLRVEAYRHGVAYSGQVATASAMVRSGAAGSPPNFAGYQVCTAAWFVASHGGSDQAATSRRVAR